MLRHRANIEKQQTKQPAIIPSTTQRDNEEILYVCSVRMIVHLIGLT